MAKVSSVDKEVVFHGNAKDSRIKNAMLILNGSGKGKGSDIVNSIIADKLHPDKRAIKRYIKNINNVKLKGSKVKVRVSKGVKK